MSKIAKVFWLYTQNSIQISLQQQVGVIFFLFGKLLRFGMFGVFIYFLMQKTQVLAGYNLYQTLIFFLTFNIIDGITQLLYREVYRFRPLILSGDFDTVLVKPIHPFVRILVGGVDVLDILPLLIYTGLLVFFMGQVGDITTTSIFMYAALVLNGVLIATAFHICVLAMGILSTEVDHTIMIYRDITRMGSFPVDIYTEPLRFFITFVVPIGLMISFPVKALFGMLSINIILLSFGLALVFFFVALRLWKFALLRYQSASS